MTSQSIFFLKTSIKELLFLFWFVLDFIFIILKIKGKSIQTFDMAIVKLDALGDLFISIEALSQLISNNKKVIVIVDEKYVEILKSFYSCEIIGINKRKFVSNIFYRYVQISKFTSIVSRIVINCNISRPDFASDPIVGAIKSEFKIGFESDFVNSKKIAKNLYLNQYSKLVSFDHSEHEIVKIERLLSALNYSLKQGHYNLLHQLNDKAYDGYFVVVLGAGKKGREWDYKNYIKIIKYILSNSSLKCVILGTKNDILTQKNIIDSLSVSASVTGMAGSSNINQYVNFIKNSSLVVCNESSALHISEFYKKQCLCICGGGHYNRFAPYPLMSNSKSIILSHKMDCFNCNWNCKYVSIDKDVPPCISKVNISDAYTALDLMLKHV